MHVNGFQPTPYPDVNALLYELLVQVQSILGRHFVGMYVDGSLTSDAFDAASDIDFIVVTDDEIDSTVFESLQVMHERITASSSRWATELEGSYISQAALRRYDSAHNLHPNIERGLRERLKWVQHDASWVIHRCIVRERGITLAGPPPFTLIDPISPADLRQAMQSMLPTWTAPILDDPTHIQARGYQSFIVLSLCRVLYTLHAGTVVSKRSAAHWAQEAVDQRWRWLIKRAWEGRTHPNEQASPADMNATLEFIQYTLQRTQQITVDLAEA